MDDAESTYRTLLESTRAIPWRIEWSTMEFTYIGPQIVDLLGWSQESWRSVDDWAARIHADDRDRVVGFCVAQSQAGIDHEADYRALAVDGSFVWMRDVVHVVRKDEQVEALVGFMFDITERKRNEEELLRLQRELEEYSFRDGLTGVANRRRFDRTLDAAWEDARTHGRPLGLVLLDLDYFKQFNDGHGHLAGDDCLIRVARLLAEEAREGDLVARIGGEEFAVLLPDTDTLTARRLAESFRTRVLEDAIVHGRSEVSEYVTVSVGLRSVVPGAGENPRSFVESVDEMLYAAKQKGRNRVQGRPSSLPPR